MTTDTMDSIVLTIRTGGEPAVVDITDEVVGFARGRGDGLVSIFVPHATAGVALIETGSGTEFDLLETLDRLLPRDEPWRHRHGSKGHGADHVLPAFVAPSITIPAVEGRVALGTWQSVVLVDLNRDNPERSLRLSFLPG
jgi:secondary thiamine-phosphate synthase enzyme